MSFYFEKISSVFFLIYGERMFVLMSIPYCFERVQKKLWLSCYAIQEKYCEASKEFLFFV